MRSAKSFGGVLFLTLLTTALSCSSETTHTGGGGSAGSGSGGGGNSGGSGGGGSITPRCEGICTAMVAAGCSATPTKNGCLLTCKAMTSAAACDATGKAYFDCAESGTFTCNDANEAVVVSCSEQYLDAVDCAVAESPNPKVVQPCAELCDAIVMAGCPNTPQLDDCKSSCLWAGATGIGCSSQWEAYLACANGVTLTCFLGSAAAPGCGPALSNYSKCINAAS